MRYDGLRRAIMVYVIIVLRPQRAVIIMVYCVTTLNPLSKLCCSTFRFGVRVKVKVRVRVKVRVKVRVRVSKFCCSTFRPS